MASRREQIRAKLTEHLLAAPLVQEVLISGLTSSKMPSVELQFGGFEKLPDSQGLLYQAGEFGLRIKGQSFDAVCEVIEQLEVWWEDNTRFAELSALGVVEIYPRSEDPPMIFSSSKSYVLADLMFYLQFSRAF